MENLDPKSIWLFFWTSMLRGMFFFIFLAIWASPFLAIVIGVTKNNILNTIVFLAIIWIILFILYVALCYFIAKLTYKYWKYELGEDAFKKESGIIWKKYISIPYERIQNVDIYRGVFARILGLSDVQIQTAGSSAVYYGRGGLAGMGAEGRLPGINKDIAEKLRDELIKRAKESKRGI